MHAKKLEKKDEVVQQEKETAETENKESDSREKHRKVMGISFSSHISLTAMAKQFKASRGTCRHMHFTMADITQGLQFEFLEELRMMVRPCMKDDHRTHTHIYIYIYILHIFNRSAHSARPQMQIENCESARSSPLVKVLLFTFPKPSCLLLLPPSVSASSASSSW